MEKITLNTPLTIDEIDFRVQSINKGGFATILAYKDARADMKRLDAVFGHDGWQRKHEVINQKEFCSVGIWSEKTNSWVWKQDCGTESMTEKAKGESSDAFKRACFNLGIGRELYDYPIIQIELLDNEWSLLNEKGEKVDKGTKHQFKTYPKATFGLKLKEWTWFSQFTDGKLNYLACKDNNGKVRFSWGEFIKPNTN